MAAVNTSNTTVVDQRPKISGFKQQTLPAWQPILHGRAVFPLFLIVGAVFIPFGSVLLMISEKVKEFRYDYTHCVNLDLPNTTCAEFLQNVNNTGKVCHCSITVELERFESPVFIYYGLANYFQNHRRYVRSRDDDQLYGLSIPPGNLRSLCEPYRTVTINESQVLGYAPCGAIANSIFNDTFSLYYLNTIPVGLLKTGIAWTTDKRNRFNNPPSWKYYTKPQNWERPVWDLDPQQEDNNGYLNEDLIVWMRTAALPYFRKFYRRVDHHSSLQFMYGLPAGIYNISIEYKYPVISFGGKKRIFISTTSILGGKNSFLGSAYITVGILNFIVGILFLINLIWTQRNKDGQARQCASVVKIRMSGEWPAMS
ncbi:hypothetical protein BsWGS_08307 [Bradybaena similaris]